MDITEIMEQRHSVRKYTDRKIDEQSAMLIEEEIQKINRESGLHFVMCLNNEEVFKANQPNYGSFVGCRNFVALYGTKKEDEKVGYYGERLVLFLQGMGINTCWVALTFEKKAVNFDVPQGMKLYDVIAMGYGFSGGHPHKSKPVEKLAKITVDSPEWFIKGVNAAMNAPTAINQQRFYLEQVGENGVRAKALLGPCYKTDIGIVKYHFEQGAGKENFNWVK